MSKNWSKYCVFFSVFFLIQKAPIQKKASSDSEYYTAAKNKLLQNGCKVGYSVGCSKNASSMELDFKKEQFVQMDAVSDDHGVFDNPGDYFTSPQYKNRPNALTLFFYRILIGSVNERIKKMRYS